MSVPFLATAARNCILGCFQLHNHTGKTLGERVVNVPRHSVSFFKDGSALALLGKVIELKREHDLMGQCLGQLDFLRPIRRKIDMAGLRYIHENKTAAILTTSARLGAMSANADAKKLAAITKFGRALGLAFQIIDDILDVTQTSEKLGKSAGKDAAAKKATYPAVIGLKKSRLEAKRLTRRAHNALSIFDGKAEALHALANYLLEREY